MKTGKNVDMLSGSQTKAILIFSIPIVLGNILQQLYNTVDAIVVGQNLGETSLAAISVASPIMSILLAFIIGCCVGISVLMAQLYGSGDKEAFHKEASTALIAGLVFTVFLAVVSNLTLEPILIWQNTPRSVIPEVKAYLNVVFIGLIFTFLYNYYFACLRAVGNSRTPFIFLAISSVLHIVLALLFIHVLKKGIVFVALSTVLSEGFSALCCWLYIRFRVPILSIGRKNLTFSKQALVQTISYSWAAALQQIVVYLGRFLTQGCMNVFGEESIAGYNAATRIEGFILTPSEGVGNAVSTFFAQNMGAGKPGRIKKGYRVGVMINFTIGATIVCLLQLFSSQIMSWFSGNSVIIGIGVKYLKFMSYFYLVTGLTTVMQGLFRGLGKLKITMAFSGLQIFIRVTCAYLLVPTFGVYGICFAVVGGWLTQALLEGILVRKQKRELDAMSLGIPDACKSNPSEQNA